jgi:hypothetical protein
MENCTDAGVGMMPESCFQQVYRQNFNKIKTWLSRKIQGAGFKSVRFGRIDCVSFALSKGFPSTGRTDQKEAVLGQVTPSA